MSESQLAIVEETLTHFRALVASDGGTLSIVSLEDNDLTVAYQKGSNDQCADCVISHDDLLVFIKEALETRAAGVEHLRVTGGEQAADG